MIPYIILLFLFFLIIFIKKIQSYWSRQGVCEIRPQFFIGNVLEIVTYRKSWGQLLLQFYNEFKNKGVKYGGIYFFLKPAFVPLDPEIIKNILVHDYKSFSDRGLYFNEEFEPISGNLFTLEGKKWKFLRTVLTPTLKSSQIKKMFQSFVISSNDLNSKILKYFLEKRSIDITDLVARFTTDVTVRCLFGMESNSIKNPECKFLQLGKKVSELSWQKSATLVLAQILPKKICGLMGLRFTDIEVEKFFLDTVKHTMDCRKTHDVSRDDFVNVMLQRKLDGQTENNNQPIYQNSYPHGLTLNDVAAQCFITFLGGYATTATVLKFSLYELANNQDVQNLLRSEINMILDRHNGELTNETLLEMEFLHAVVLETLRKYPVFPVILRNCNQTYQVPGTNVTLDKGTVVNIPVLGLHMDPNYYPNPERFDPKRFIKENRKLIKDFTFFPFGAGPRMCIGYRFGTLMVKVGLVAFVKDYNISLSEDTKRPVELSPNSFFVSTKDKIWITLTKIKNE